MREITHDRCVRKRRNHSEILRTGTPPARAQGRRGAGLRDPHPIRPRRSRPSCRAETSSVSPRPEPARPRLSPCRPCPTSPRRGAPTTVRSLSYSPPPANSRSRSLRRSPPTPRSCPTSPCSRSTAVRPMARSWPVCAVVRRSSSAPRSCHRSPQEGIAQARQPQAPHPR